MTMPPPPTRYAALALGAALTLPAAAAWAGDGGAPLDSSSTTAASSPVATRTAAGTTLRAKRAALVKKRHTFTGAVPRRARGRSVAIQRRAGAAWKTVATSTASKKGRFAASYVPRASGRYTYRATVGGAVRSAPQVGVTVFKRARATWYGPGFYGNSTACGTTLSKDTLGVAHKTLPCGSKVTLMYGGRTITVKGIDRGPYSPNFDFDLTEATKDALGMPGTSTIGALPRR